MFSGFFFSLLAIVLLVLLIIPFISVLSSVSGHIVFKSKKYVIHFLLSTTFTVLKMDNIVIK